MSFEFDSQKSAANKKKHGIDFVEAQKIWIDEMRVETPAQSIIEPRMQVLGMIGDKLWSAFFTYRHDKIRIISVRRARTDEQERYDGL